MKFNQGAEIVTANGEKTGSLKQIVIDPKTKEVAHLVIRKGGLLTADKVISIEIIERTIGEKIGITIRDQELVDLPDFQEDHFIKLHQEERAPKDPSPLFWYPPDNSWWRPEFQRCFSQPKYVEKTKLDIPVGMVALQEGAKVMSRDQKHLGNIEKYWLTSAMVVPPTSLLEEVYSRGRRSC